MSDELYPPPLLPDMRRARLGPYRRDHAGVAPHPGAYADAGRQPVRGDGGSGEHRVRGVQTVRREHGQTH